MKYFLIVVFCLLSSLCQAEIVTVTTHTATLWTQPGGKNAFEILKIPRYYPLSVQEQGQYYVKVRDYQGQTGWILAEQIGPQKGVVVEVATVNVRQGPGARYPILFKAFQGVTFKVLAEQKGWLKVRHENGEIGWVLKSLTWGQ